MKFLFKKMYMKHKLQFNTSQKKMLSALVDSGLLSLATISNSYKTIEFFAYSVCPLNQYLELVEKQRGVPKLSYDEAAQMYIDLRKQIFCLQQYSCGFSMFVLDKIMVIDESTFIYCGGEELLDFSPKEDKDNEQQNKRFKLMFTVPFSKTRKNVFIAPEVASIDRLPYSVDSQCIHQSLEQLLSFCLIDGIMPDLYFFAVPSFGGSVEPFLPDPL